MLQNSQLRFHGEKIITTLDLLIKTLTSASGQKIDLVTLGRHHYGYGLKQEYFIVNL